MDGYRYPHSILCTFASGTGAWRIDVWHLEGCLLGKLHDYGCVQSRPSQTLSPTYALEVVPTIIWPYDKAFVCMCWGAGMLLLSGVFRAMVDFEGDLGWHLPFALQ